MARTDGEVRHPPTVLAGGYGLLAGGWIVVSDRISGAQLVETVKGLGFVAVTAALLFLLATAYERRGALARRRLQASEERFRTVVEENPGRVAMIDASGTITLHAGHGGRERAESLEGESVFDLYAGNEPVLQAVRQALGGTRSRVRAPVGDETWDVHYQPVRQDGAVTGAIAVATDVTAEVRADAELARSEIRYRSIVETATEGIAILDRDAITVFGNPQLARIFGVPLESMLGRSFLDLLDDHARDLVRAGVQRRMAGVNEQYEVELYRPDGQWRWVLISASPLDLDGQRYALGMVSDITDRKRAEAQLLRQSFYDELTGLANRSLLVDRIEQALVRVPHPRGVAGLLLVDLDRFKLVNESYGRSVGDKVLAEVARRLQAAVDPEDTVARLGSDQFCVLTQAAGAEQVVALAGRLQASLAEPVAVPIGELFLTAGIGIATGPVPDADTLIRNADAAVHRAKQRGPARVEVHDEAVRAQVHERLVLGSELVRALSERQLLLHYQPVVCLACDAVVGVEALVRWQHPTRGLVAADQFIEVLEDSGLAVELGAWGIREACRQAAAWAHLGPGGNPLRVSVNVSPRQLANQPLVELVQEALAESGASPSALVVEVTEHAVMDDVEEAARVLGRLAELGVGISVDDFGTGYSSMAWLTQFPISELKIDRSHVAAALTDVGARAIINAIVGLADALDLVVVGEGVETSEQRQFLADIGCTLGQGWLWARALPDAQIAPLLASLPGCPDPSCRLGHIRPRLSP